VEKSRLGLGASKAELAHVAWAAPSGVIGSQKPEPLGHARLVEPFDLARTFAKKCVKALGSHELYGAGTVFADMNHEREGVAR
jgi:hypothetical protein